MRLIGLAVVLAVGLAISPSIAVAQQQGVVHRIGFLGPRYPSDTLRLLQAFRQGLTERGWVEGRNIVIEYRFAEGKIGRLPDLAAELLHHEKVEIVVVEGADAVRAVQQLSKTIPIVMAESSLPIEWGFVQSLARPGGNITGLTFTPVEAAGKRLELLKEIVPKLSRVAVVWNPRVPSSAHQWKEIQHPARQLGVQLQSLEAESRDAVDRAFKEATRARADAVIVLLGVGRPDLIGAGSEAMLAEQLHESLGRIMTLPDHLEIFPAHFGGAACGKGLSGKPGSTIGFERRFNPALQAKSRAEFVDFVLAGLPPQPDVFAENRRRNLTGT